MWDYAYLEGLGLLYLLMSADCEATGHSVDDAALGERETRGLLEIAAQEGMRVTLFVIPGDLEASPTLYREAHDAGHEVGLHIHPADQGYGEFLGVYGPDEQRAIVSEASDRFAAVMGFEPLAGCPGYHSANDHTFPVLVELGFRHGCVSTPTRVLPECAAVWAGAPLDIHYAHPANRLMQGGLDFVNIPHTIDPESRVWGGKTPLDLRVEAVDAKDHWYTMRKAVERQIAASAPLPYLSITTHNVFDYGEPDGFRRKTLLKMIGHARRVATGKGMALEPVTHADFAQAYRERCPFQKDSKQELTLDTSGRS